MTERERYDEENIAFRERMRLGREMRGISIGEMAQLARVSTGLIIGIEEDHTFITHPNIAARVMAEAGVRDKRMMRHIVHRKHWGMLPRIPRQRAESVLEKMREDERKRLAEIARKADIAYYGIIAQRVEERRGELMEFWARYGISVEETGIPLRKRNLSRMIEMRGWSPEKANRMLCYRVRDGLEGLMVAGTSTVERFNLLATALDCDLRDIVDTYALKVQRRYNNKNLDSNTPRFGVVRGVKK